MSTAQIIILAVITILTLIFFSVWMLQKNCNSEEAKIDGIRSIPIAILVTAFAILFHAVSK